MKCYYFQISKQEWKEPYIDHYNADTRNATIIFNFGFEDKKSYADIFQYTLSHVAGVVMHVPEGTLVSVIYDIRGQNVEMVNFKDIEVQLQEKLNSMFGKTRFNILCKG